MGQYVQRKPVASEEVAEEIIAGFDRAPFVASGIKVEVAAVRDVGQLYVYVVQSGEKVPEYALPLEGYERVH